MGEGEPGVRRSAYSSLSLKGRGTGAQRQGEGILGRGKTLPPLLALAREARQETTEAEDRLWERLRDRRLQGYKFRRQPPLGRFRPDFTCPSAKLVIEVDGSQHVEAESQDAGRTAFFEAQGYWVLRVWNNDVLGDIDAVHDGILAAFTAPHPGAGAPVPLPFREREK